MTTVPRASDSVGENISDASSRVRFIKASLPLSTPVTLRLPLSLISRRLSIKRLKSPPGPPLGKVDMFDFSSMVLKLQFKVSSGPSFEQDIPASATVAELKKLVAAASSIPDTQQRVIYKGRILKDSDTLQQHGVESGHTIHLVKGPGAAPAPAPVQAAAAPAAPTPAQVPAPSHPATTGALAPPTSLPFASDPNFQNAFGAMAATPQNFSGMDPSTMSSLLQTPMFQQMMQSMSENPELLASMMRTSPMMQQAVQQNPQMAAILNNPELLRMMLNPQTMQAMLQLQQAMGQQPNYGGMMQAMAANPSLAQSLAAPPLPAQAVAELSQRFAEQLQQMEMMGFVDKEANLEALAACDGNVEMAINFLLSQGF